MDTGQAAFGVASLRMGSSYRERGGGDVFSRAASSRADSEDDEEALMWAALERLPTHSRVRKGIVGDGGGGELVDVAGLGFQERTRLLERLVRVAEEDHERFLLKLRQRIDRVGLDFPTIEVRYDHLNIEALAHVGNRGLPTFINTTLNTLESLADLLHIIPNNKIPMNILHDVNGIIKPKRMTLLLGPPGSGKTTLLLALAGKLGSDLKVSGKVTYNGHGMNEFVAQRSAAYISQHDLHIAEMTVRETLAFSARCQGVGSRYDMLTELSRREKAANIKPDPDLDVYMKAISVGGQDTNIITDYILKILGLDICADTMVGDDMLRGISGGQRKRVTTGEMMVGAERALFMDEISTGLDSSTTYQIVKSLGLITNILSGTTVISLLQPAPETYNLFDDIILLSDGYIVYQGPRENVLEFFESMGFKCPDRKGVADFLQEVTSRKDQAQYWARTNQRYHYVPVKEFARAFHAFHVGQSLSAELSHPFDRSQCHPASLTTSTYGASKSELLRACIEREWLLMKRNMFVYRFRAFQLLVMTTIVMTLFLRTNMHHGSVNNGTVYLGALFFCIVAHMFNGFSELALATIKLPVFFKQRDYLFFPSWAYAIPTWILKIPISCIEVAITVFLGYYVIGFDPDVGRLFKQYLLLLLVNQMAAALFRFIAALGRTMVVANTLASFALLVLLVLSGFVLSHHDVKKWWIWGYWMSPLQYAMSAIAVNEFLGQKWQTVLQGSNNILGVDVLKSRGFFTEAKWYWIGAGALLGYVIVFNILFTVALSYLKPFGKSQQILSEDALKEKHASITGEVPDELSSSTSAGNINNSRRNSASGDAPGDSRRGMVLPFAPLAVAFNNMRYSVDMPAEMKAQGVDQDRLLLLKGVSGSFKPGVLTALMGVSGAGKTTLMDVLAGRKTGGYIEGDISISGYPKKQETFARISGYCEQNDIHSPNVTVYESLVYSAWLRLPSDVESETRKMFIEEVMELVELNSLRDALVGLPGVNGLSTEQRKRLTIAVELVANPSIIFMDEPTSGLDARAAAIVMRTVRNTVDTGRTVVCTIHQPSIDIFEAFDELFLMKRGGEEIYVGPLGHQSCELIEYFEGIQQVSKIKPGYNPATWMLEVTSQAQEDILGVSFAEEKPDHDQRHQQGSCWLQGSPLPDAVLSEVHHPVHGVPVEAAPVLLEEPAVHRGPLLLLPRGGPHVRYHILAPRRQEVEAGGPVQRDGVHVRGRALHGDLLLVIGAACGGGGADGVLPGEGSGDVLGATLRVRAGGGGAPLRAGAVAGLRGHRLRHDRLPMGREEVLLVHLLHVLHAALLHLLRHAHRRPHPELQHRIHRLVLLLRRLEPLLRIRHLTADDAGVVEVVLVGVPRLVDAIRAGGLAVRRPHGETRQQRNRRAHQRLPRELLRIPSRLPGRRRRRGRWVRRALRRRLRTRHQGAQLPEKVIDHAPTQRGAQGSCWKRVIDAHVYSARRTRTALLFFPLIPLIFFGLT